MLVLKTRGTTNSEGYLNSSQRGMKLPDVAEDGSTIPTFTTWEVIDAG